MRCETCEGIGVIHCISGQWIGWKPCPACNGTGIASCCDGAVGGPDEVTNGGTVDPRNPDYSRPGIFATHNCWKCSDGIDLSCCPTPDRPGNCGYSHARDD